MADCGLRTADCGLRTADGESHASGRIRDTIEILTRSDWDSGDSGDSGDSWDSDVLDCVSYGFSAPRLLK
jgi:hypothetical protein